MIAERDFECVRQLSRSLDVCDADAAARALLAVVTGFVVYISAPWVLSHAATAEQLRNSELLWTEVATGGAWFIMPGLWGAIWRPSWPLLEHKSARPPDLVGPKTT